LASAPLLALISDEALRLLAMASLATAAGVAGSMLRPEDPARLQTFFEQVRPPGWWGPIATRAGVDPREGLRRLKRAGAATATAAWCCFSLLTGVGSWIAQSPAPTWWPAPWGAWVASQLVVGVALVPVWLRLGFADDEPSGARS